MGKYINNIPWILVICLLVVILYIKLYNNTLDQYTKAKNLNLREQLYQCEETLVQDTYERCDNTITEVYQRLITCEEKRGQNES